MSTSLSEPEAASGGTAPGAPLLEVTGLTKHFPVTRGIIFRHKVGAVQAVDGVTFSVNAGETLGLVGESGCGKTTTGRLLTRLLEPTGGQIIFDGARHHATCRLGKMRPLRRDIQMIFQDPYSSLNPRQTVGTDRRRPDRLQTGQPRGGHRGAVQELLELVGLNPEHYNRYPHEFSGGQRQRIGIARALALQAQADRRRRAGLGAGRLDPGAGGQPAGGPAARARPDLRRDRARPVGGPAHLRPRRGDVSRQARRDRRPGRRCTPGRGTPTRSR